MIYSILFKIFFTSMFVFILFAIILIYCKVEDISRKLTYGDTHYKEDHFREYFSNENCLVNKEDREEYGLPEYIRYFGVDLLSKEICFVEGFRIEDRAIVNEKEYLVISRTQNIDEEDALKRKGLFTDCKAIIKIEAKEGTYYLYCV